MTPVAVIMVNYRSAALALRALASLDQERARHLELALSAHVVENASGDESALRSGIAGRFSHFAHLIVSPVNGGFGAGNNLGLRAALEREPRTAYVHFLNPDTELRPGAILALVRFLESHSRAGVAGGSFERADGTPWPIGFRFPSIWSELEAGCRLALVTRFLGSRAVARRMGDAAEPVDWISGASMIFRREVLETIGGFDEKFFLYFEEVDLCRRLARAGWERWYVPESRVMHVCGASTGVDGASPRLPRYWFESRKRYFLKHHGWAYSQLAGAASRLGYSVGALKDRIKEALR